MAIILSVMSVGATVYGRNDSNRIRGSIQNTQDQVNVNVLGQLGMAFGNPGYANLLGRIGHLRRMNRDELVRIFETEFRNIIVRDANTIDQIDMRLFGNLLFRLFEYNFDMLGDAPHL